MIISDLSRIEGRRYPARRRTQNLVVGAAPIQCKNFCIGNVTHPGVQPSPPVANPDEKRAVRVAHSLS